VLEVRKARGLNPPFNPQKENDTFIEARQEFVTNDAEASTSKGYGDQRQKCEGELVQSIPAAVQTATDTHKNVSFVTTFLKTMLGLLKNEEVVSELSEIINTYENPPKTTATKESSPVGSKEQPGNLTEKSLIIKDVKQVTKKPRTSQEFRINAQIGEYDIDNIVLDLGSDVNVMLKKTWELMGKPKLVWSPISLKLANQHKSIPFGRLELVSIDIEGVRSTTTFEVIEIVDNSIPYLTLLGFEWDFENLSMVNLKKIKMVLEQGDIRISLPPRS